ncbi:MAG: single-stranded DNA-binding protein [Candidatus Taylorbacteria bacterium]
MYLNKVYIIGNLTRDPEIKALPSGTKVCSFSVATNRSYKDKDGERKDTSEFHNIVAFAKLGELSAQYLKKGQQALIEGRIQTRSWDAPNGEKKYRTEIIADNIQFGFRATGGPSAGGSPSGANNSNSQASASASGSVKEGEVGEAPSEKDKIDYPQEEISPDDIPF